MCYTTSTFSATKRSTTCMYHNLKLCATLHTFSATKRSTCMYHNLKLCATLHLHFLLQRGQQHACIIIQSYVLLYSYIFCYKEVNNIHVSRVPNLRLHACYDACRPIQGHLSAPPVVLSQNTTVN